jgi:predicted nucleic-acid-binding protein
MLAVDTNVVVRYLTADDPAQFARAAEIVEGDDTFIGLTVLLETEWVLRSIYRYEPAQVVLALRSLAGMPRVMLESPETVATALNWTTDGMDFADALHLSAAGQCDSFVTFDRKLGNLARRLNTPTVEVL